MPSCKLRAFCVPMLCIGIGGMLHVFLSPAAFWRVRLNVVSKMYYMEATGKDYHIENYPI